ncbi:MAG: hypothetical protein AAFY60_01250 [Myxococcota bacterium]
MSLSHIREMMKEDNRRLLRAGLVVAPSEFMLQVSQVVRRAANPKRRLLYTEAELIKWLAPALSPVELTFVEQALVV